MEGQARGAGRLPAMEEEDRRRLILEAAEGVFSRDGFGAATMEEIARACGMAKKTLYRLFPDKTALFTALIETRDHPRHAWTEIEEADATKPDSLRDLLLNLGHFVLSPRQVRLTRLVIAEAQKTPELARRFYDEVITQNRHIVTEHVIRRSGLRPIDGVDPVDLVDTFIGGILNLLQLRVLMMDLDAEAIEAELVARVDITLVVLRQFSRG
jgi:AcrR family transcriptional regulator